jgi:Ran GTPase-activating protein (RanGAP) involved in mRNA processing and transport
MVYVNLILFIFLLTNFSLASDDLSSEKSGFSSSKIYIKEHIERLAEGQKKEQSIALELCEQPLIIGDSASLELRHVIQAHQNAGFQWFGFYHPERVIDWQDHGYHYLTGQINKAVFERTKASHINYVILGLDAVVVMRMQDEYGHCYLERVTKPILFDRKTGKLTLAATDTTEYTVFLSYPKDGKRESVNKYKNVVALSETEAFRVTDLHDNEYKIYFYPIQVSEGEEAFNFMSSFFPKLAEKRNFDSEVHAVYALRRNPKLIMDFINGIHDAHGFVRVGLRYYSFLDTCENCQEFLVDNQTILKKLFMRAIRSRFPESPNIPFLSFAHNNRIYRDNNYKAFPALSPVVLCETEKFSVYSLRSDESNYPIIMDHHEHDESAAEIISTSYKYAVSGGATGRFIRGELVRYENTIIPRSHANNRLISTIHEPDLGREDDLGIVRQYFTHLQTFEFQEHEYEDRHAEVLATKLRRINPLALKIVNLSGNYLGIDMPECFPGEGICLTSAEELSEIIRSLAQCPNLEELSLSGNSVSRSGPLFSLKASLKKWPELRRLVLDDVKMRREDFFYIIGNQLMGNTKLEILNLNNNYIHHEGTSLLLGLLPSLPSLRELHIAYCALCFRDDRELVDDPVVTIYNPDVFFALAQTVIDHPTLAFLDVSHYTVQIKEDHFKKFVKKVKDGKPTLILRGKREVFETMYGDDESFEEESFDYESSNYESSNYESSNYESSEDESSEATSMYSDEDGSEISDSENENSEMSDSNDDD